MARIEQAKKNAGRARLKGRAVPVFFIRSMLRLLSFPSSFVPIVEVTTTAIAAI